MIWGCIFIVAMNTLLVKSMEWNYFPPRARSILDYFIPPFFHKCAFEAEPTAMDLMVDITNSLGLRVFQEHFRSSGNFAFSPYGMISVLVVLYEGACGESARQIQRIVGFPPDKDVMRTGFRDIHRRLRSYFSHEGFLSGIALNKEISTLNPEFKLILKFYGYDVDLSVDDYMKVNEKKLNTTTARTSESTATPSMDVMTTGSTTASNLDVELQSANKEIDSVPGHKNATTEWNMYETSTIPASTIQTESSAEITTLSSGESKTNKVELENNDITTITTTLATEKDLATGSTTGVSGIFTEIKTESQLPNLSHETTQTNDIQRSTIPFTSTITSITPEDRTTLKVSLEESTTTENRNDITSALDNGMLIPQFINFETTTIALSTTNIEGLSETFPYENNKGTKLQTVTSTPQSLLSSDETTLSTPNDEISTLHFQTTEMEDNGSTTETTTFENSKTTVFETSIASNTQTTENLETPTENLETAEETSVATEANVADSTLSATITSESAEGKQITTEEKQTVTTSPEIENNDHVDSTTIYSTTLEYQKSTFTESDSTVKTTILSTNDATEYSTTKFPPPTTVTVTESLSANIKSFDLPNSTEKSSETYKKRRRRFLRNITNHLQSNVRTPIPTNKHSNKKTTRRRRRRRTILDYFNSPIWPDMSFQPRYDLHGTYFSKDLDSSRNLPRHLFLVDGVTDTFVPMMTYTNIFRYGYIPRIHSKALEFPLDDIRYKLLILLPLERRGFRQLLLDLGGCSLREIIESIQPTRVRAVIPKFMVEGFVVLTPILQKLGIHDVFDPRRSNLSGMSNDPELYVRNVEQSVTVVIRNYVEILDIQTRTMGTRQVFDRFEASHPFLYFVLDSATNVALMAGQMLNPLNSRLY